MQWACIAHYTGQKTYAINMSRSLIARGMNDYTLTFFDYNAERGNRKKVQEHFAGCKVALKECNSLDYRVMMKNDNVFDSRSYQNYTDTDGDVYWFPSIINSIPPKFDGVSIVTLHDVIPITAPDSICTNKADVELFCKQFKAQVNRLKHIYSVIVTSSEFSREDILSVLPEFRDRTFVVPCGTDAPLLLESDEKATLDRFKLISGEYIYFVGGIVDVRKNSKRLIQAFEQIALKYPSLKLVLTGSTSPDTIEDVMQSPMNSRIIITGMIYENEKWLLYKNAALFVFPSLYEGFGLPVIEAQISGCPVITSNTTSLPEVSGEGAILVNPCDTGQLAFEIDRVLSSSDLRNSLIEKGLNNAKQFSWDNAAEKLEKVFETAYALR